MTKLLAMIIAVLSQMSDGSFVSRQSIDAGNPERTMYALDSAVNIITMEANPTQMPMR